jgi:hypothetical protein
VSRVGAGDAPNGLRPGVFALNANKLAGPAFAGKLPSSLRFDATSPQYKLAGQAGAASEDQSCFDMWANIRIMSHINLRKFFGRSPDFHNFCLSQIDFAVFLEFLIKRRLSRFSMGIFQAGCAVSTLAVRWRALSEVWTGALRRPRRRAKRRSF